MKTIRTRPTPGVRKCLAAAVLAAFAISGPAFAVDEDEATNNTPTPGQQLVIGADGSVTVNGVIGVQWNDTATGYIPDVDYYGFDVQGQVDSTTGCIVKVTADIDNGMHADFTGVDTILALFGPQVELDGTTTALAVLDQVDDAPDIDPGSESTSDARIDGWCMTEPGHYVVGVSSFPRSFAAAGELTSTDVPMPSSNGAYTLIISGLQPPVVTPPPPPPPPVVTPPPPPPPPPAQQVRIRINPNYREHEWNERDHGKAKGTVAVAVLSSPTFDAFQIDPQSLRFGKTGTENSFVACYKRGVEVNHDRRRDLLCRFDSSKTGFGVGDTEGKLTGRTVGGASIEGRGWLKVFPTQKRHHDERSRHDNDDRKQSKR
jgi:hypothetical protein